MIDRPMSSFALSATLHATVAAILLLFAYAARQQAAEMPRVFELVAGAGDDLSARLAPKLGDENGVKLTVPPPPQLETVKAEPPKVEPPPLQAPPPPAPVKKKAEAVPLTKPPEPKVPNFKDKLVTQVRAADRKAKKEVAKQRADEAKRQAAEDKKRQAEEKAKQAKMTKEEFDRLNKTKATAKTSRQVAKIDTKGITGGVAEGSSESKAGQGGKALVRDNDDELQVYYAMFKDRMRRAFEPPPGLSDTLVAHVEVVMNADGSLSGARIVRTSGSRVFDQAILEAIRQIRLPAKPDRKSEKIQFDFSAREQGN